MRLEFLPFNYSRTLYHKMHNLRQETHTVDAYTEEFYQLLSRTDLHESDEQLISRYVGGLQITFEDVLNLLSPTSIYEAHQRALALEKQFNRPSLALPFPFVARQIASNPATETLASSSRPTPSPGPPRGTSPHPPPAPPDTTQRGQFPPAFPPAHGPCFPAGRLGTACPSALGRVLLMAC
ncbi:hypothetical protein ACS0TY_006269 [Phlomoides rotata]